MIPNFVFRILTFPQILQYVCSFYWATSTLIYLLPRHHMNPVCFVVVVYLFYDAVTSRSWWQERHRPSQSKLSRSGSKQLASSTPLIWKTILSPYSNSLLGSCSLRPYPPALHPLRARCQTTRDWGPGTRQLETITMFKLTNPKSMQLLTLPHPLLP